MSKSNDILTVVLGAVGLIGIGYTLATRSQLVKVSERLDKSIDEIASGMEFDIPEELIKKSVEKAVQIESKKAVEKATNEAIATLKRDIHNFANTEVNREYSEIKDIVLKEIEEAAAKIDINRVRRDVEEAAKKVALDKFDDNLDDILEKFNDNLSSTAKIYSSINEALNHKTNSDREFVVRLN